MTIGGRPTAAEHLAWRANELAHGEFQCRSCRYGIVVSRSLPFCPMCNGESWEPSRRDPSAALLRSTRTRAPITTLREPPNPTRTGFEGIAF
jgi:hypothetical protein